MENCLILVVLEPGGILPISLRHVSNNKQDTTTSRRRRRDGNVHAQRQVLLLWESLQQDFKKKEPLEVQEECDKQALKNFVLFVLFIAPRAVRPFHLFSYNTSTSPVAAVF